MSRRKWFRLYHGFSSDVTMAVIARQCNLGRCEVLALWLCLLEHASQAKDPGSVKTFSAEEAALILDLPLTAVENIVHALRERKKIDKEDRITDWDKAQPSSVRRVRKHRNAPPSAPAPRTSAPIVDDYDSPSAVAARRARLQQNSALIIGNTPTPKNGSLQK